jgi:hypothetical protein
MVQGAVRFRLLFLNSTAMTNEEFKKALRSSRKLFAYALFNSNNGAYMLQVKADYLKVANEGHVQHWDATITDTSIYLG